MGPTASRRRAQLLPTERFRGLGFKGLGFKGLGFIGV